jgi:predicted dehydrogenase
VSVTSPAHHVLVVGVGSIGERHLRCFLATGRARASFVEPNAALRATIAERYPHAKGFDSLDAAFAGGDFDCAVLATPAPMHIPQASRLVERGTHVLIEKPLSVSLDGVDALTDAVAARGVVAAVAYVMRAQPALAAMRQAIRDGRFGRPLQLAAVAGQDFPFYRPAYRQTYYAKRESGGGAVQDALTHVLNAGQWLLDAEISRVVADAAHLSIPGVDVEDTVHVLARHGDSDGSGGGGVLASYCLNQHQAPNETTITVACERGTIRLDLHASRWRSATKPGEPWTDHDSGPPLDRDGPFVRQASAFLDAVEGASPPLCTFAEGVATLRANLAILRSVEMGRWVSTEAVGAENIV